MSAGIRSFLSKLGYFILLVGPVIQIGLSVWSIFSSMPNLDGQAERTVALQTLFGTLPQILADMALGGVLILLCRIDRNLELRAH